MARRWAFLRVIAGRHELKPERYDMKRPRLPDHLRPDRKLAAATGTSVAGAPIVDWIANGVFDLSMPGVVAAEIAILIGGAVGWFVRNRL